MQLTTLCVLAGVAAIAVGAPARGGAAVAAAARVPHVKIITRGGVYSGTYYSNNPKVPAVTIRTAQPVTLLRCNIAGRGQLIAAVVPHCHVAIRDCHAVALNPGVRGVVQRRFFTAESFASVRITGNVMVHTAGIYLLSFGGTNAQHAPTLDIQRNAVLDIDGRKSNGRGGYLSYNVRVNAVRHTQQRGYRNRQFVQLDKVRHVPGMVIAWNQVVNQPGHSRVEDNISIYKSSGTRASPILIHDNYIQGAYTVNPSRGGKRRRGNWVYAWGYTGGGIMLGDGKARNRRNAPAFVRAYHNIVVATTNYGIAISSGHDLQIVGNRVVACGRLPGGAAIPDQNVGIYIWDSMHQHLLHPPLFFNNRGRGNMVGWMGKKKRNDWWTPNAAAWAGNRHWPGRVTQRTQERQWRRWQRRLRRHHVVMPAIAAPERLGYTIH